MKKGEREAKGCLGKGRVGGGDEKWVKGKGKA